MSQLVELALWFGTRGCEALAPTQTGLYQDTPKTTALRNTVLTKGKANKAG
jgi:hypothetical protein